MTDPQPLGRVDAVRVVACPTCRKTLSENAMSLALQGKTVRCTGCRMDIKLPENVRQALLKSRRQE